MESGRDKIFSKKCNLSFSNDHHKSEANLEKDYYQIDYNDYHFHQKANDILVLEKYDKLSNTSLYVNCLL